MDENTQEAYPDLSELIDGLQHGDQECMDRFEPYVREQLQAFITRRLGLRLAPRISVDDVVQEILFAVVVAVRDQRRDIRNLRAWLFGVTRHCIAQVARRRSLDFDGLDVGADDDAGRRREPASPGPGPRTRLVEKESEEGRRRNLKQLLGVLTPEQREVLRLRYYEHLSFQRIAQRTNQTPSAAQRMHARAIAKLRERKKKRRK